MTKQNDAAYQRLLAQWEARTQAILTPEEYATWETYSYLCRDFALAGVAPDQTVKALETDAIRAIGRKVDQDRESRRLMRQIDAALKARHPGP